MSFGQRLKKCIFPGGPLPRHPLYLSEEIPDLKVVAESRGIKLAIPPLKSYFDPAVVQPADCKGPPFSY